MSVNVGFSPHSKAVVTALARDSYRKALADGRFRMVDAMDEPEDAELITPVFDPEDSGPLEGDLDRATGR